MNRKYSIIIPVYNRPHEIDELLESLTSQTYQNFEVIIVEDGSQKRCDHIVEKYVQQLNISYFFKINEGQGFARNYGYEKANGDYFIVFDSDCVIPSRYLKEVNTHLDKHYLDAFGGPDKANESFSRKQKAINYAMTSFFTTGGTRGRKKGIGPYHPRSFNMGISPAVYTATGGYIIPFKGEDIEFSIRIVKNGFKTGLIPEAFVYHKRRINWWQFFKQLHFFGKARINISRFHPDQLKIVHFSPFVFTLGLSILILTLIFHPTLSLIIFIPYFLFSIVLFADSLKQNKNLAIAIMSVWAGFIQLFAYGTGFIQEGLIKIFKG